MEESKVPETPTPPSPYITRTGRVIARPRYLIEESSRPRREDTKDKGKGVQERTGSQQQDRRHIRQLQAEYTERLEREKKRQQVTQRHKEEFSKKLKDCSQLLDKEVDEARKHELQAQKEQLWGELEQREIWYSKSRQSIDIQERIQSLTTFQELSEELGYEEHAKSIEEQAAQVKQLLQDQEERRISDEQFLKPLPQTIIPSPLLQPIADAESEAQARELERLHTEVEELEVKPEETGEQAETKSEGELFDDNRITDSNKDSGSEGEQEPAEEQHTEGQQQDNKMVYKVPQPEVFKGDGLKRDPAIVDRWI